MSAVVGSAAGLRAGPTLQGGDATTLERLARAVEKRPDLKGLVPFWIDIYRVLIATREELLETQGDLQWSLHRERLQNGEPQLTADDLPLAEEALRSCAGRLAAAWRQHDPSQMGEEGQDWVARVRQAFADPTLMFGQRHELSFIEALAALALVPHLEWAAQAIGPLLEAESEPWGRGGCPVCGGHPDLALLVGDPAERRLICSRCSSAWFWTPGRRSRWRWVWRARCWRAGVRLAPGCRPRRGRPFPRLRWRWPRFAGHRQRLRRNRPRSPSAK
mgnify:CR=1 FL=1